VSSPDLSVTPDDASLRDLTIRVGDSGSEVRRARVPDQDDSDLGPFADDDLGDLGDLDSDVDADGPTVSPDTDAGDSGGQAAASTVRRDADADSNPLSETAGRQSSPSVADDLSRSVTGVTALSSVGEGPAADTDPSVDPGVEPTTGADEVGAVGEGVDVGVGEGLGDAFGEGLDSPLDTGGRTDPTPTTRTDSDVRTDFDSELRSDLDTRTDLDTRSDLRFDLEQDNRNRRRDPEIDFDGEGDGDLLPGDDGSEQRYEFETLELI
jgi:hypothetical protein